MIVSSKRTKYSNHIAVDRALDSLEAMKRAGLSPLCALVYLAIARRIHRTTGTAFPSYARIAEDAGVSIATAKRAVKALVTAGFLGKTERVVAKNRTSNLYEILNPAPSCQSDTTPGISLIPLQAPFDTTPGISLTPEVVNGLSSKGSSQSGNSKVADEADEKLSPEKHQDEKTETAEFEKVPGLTNAIEGKIPVTNPDNALEEKPASEFVLFGQETGVCLSKMSDPEKKQFFALVKTIQGIDPAVDPYASLRWAYKNWDVFANSDSRTGPEAPTFLFMTGFAPALVASYKETVETDAMSARREAERKAKTAAGVSDALQAKIAADERDRKEQALAPSRSEIEMVIAAYEAYEVSGSNESADDDGLAAVALQEARNHLTVCYLSPAEIRNIVRYNNAGIRKPNWPWEEVKEILTNHNSTTKETISC